MKRILNWIIHNCILIADSLEDRIEHYAKKRRIDIIDSNEAAQRKLDLANRSESNNCEKMETQS